MHLSSSFGTQLVIVTVGIVLPIISWMMTTQGHTHPMFYPLNNNQITAHLKGKQILIVGGADGIGSALANELHRHGSSLTITGTDRSHAKHLHRGIDFVRANMSTMRGAQDLGGNLLKGKYFDTVVFAGGFVPRPLVFAKGEGGEEDLETSYLSRFIILKELIQNHALIGRKRVYIVAYPGEDPMLSAFEDMWFDWTDYKQIPYYVNTVLFNDALIKEAARRYPGLNVLGVNPGFLSRGGSSDSSWKPKSLFSRFLERLLTIWIKTPESYVRHTMIQILASPDLDSKSGSYIGDALEDLPPKKWFANQENRKLVWENSEKLVEKALG